MSTCVQLHGTYASSMSAEVNERWRECISFELTGNLYYHELVGNSRNSEGISGIKRREMEGKAGEHCASRVSDESFI
jgi:hypothetical protein